MEKAKENLELITRYFSDFTQTQKEQFLALGELYKDWNSKINVISRKDEESLYDKHILHSLSIAAAFDFKEGMNVLDIGTGGGFPGIPLAIFFPGVNFLLADSIGKKIKVVQAVADAIALKNVTAVHTRAEDIKNKKFDVVVSRAVAPLGDLWRWAKTLIGQRGEGRGETGEGKGQRGDGRRERGEGRGETGEVLPVPNGLICLKGGDLTQEIAESGCRPRIMEVYEIFDLEVFKEKYILYVPV